MDCETAGRRTQVPIPESVPPGPNSNGRRKLQLPMMASDSFDFWLIQAGEVGDLSPNDARSDLRMVRFQIVNQIIQSATLSCAMANENDFLSRHEVLRNLLVERGLLRHTLSRVVSLPAVDQVPEESVGIPGPDRRFAFRPRLTHVLIKPSGMMIDDDDNASRGRRRCGDRNFCFSFTQKFANARHFIGFETVRPGTTQ